MRLKRTINAILRLSVLLFEHYIAGIRVILFDNLEITAISWKVKKLVNNREKKIDKLNKLLKK